MGSEQSSANHNYSLGNQENIPEKPSYEIEGALQYVKKSQNDPIYGEFKLMQHPQTQTNYAVKSFFVQSDDDFDKIYQKANQLYHLQQKSPYMLKIYSLGKDMQEDMCSKYINVQLVFDYLKDTLNKKILYRKKTQVKFREIDIYFLIKCAIDALKAMDAIGLAHGDLSPNTILLGKDGNYQLSEINFMAGKNAYRHFLLGGKGNCYLSPDLLTNLKQRDMHPDHNPRLSDIFALGMICLEMATLTDINMCYNFTEFCLNYERIQDLLNQISEEYSQELALLIAGMIDVQEHKRYDLEEIQEILSQIDEQLKGVHCSPIRNNEPFSTDIIENSKRVMQNAQPNQLSEFNQQESQQLDNQNIINNNEFQPYLNFEHINLETEEKGQTPPKSQQKVSSNNLPPSNQNLQQQQEQEQEEQKQQKPKSNNLPEDEDGDYNEGIEEDIEFHQYQQQLEQSQQPQALQQQQQQPEMFIEQQPQQVRQSPQKFESPEKLNPGNKSPYADFSENFDIPNEEDDIIAIANKQQPLHYKESPPAQKQAQKLEQKIPDTITSPFNDSHQNNISPINNTISPYSPNKTQTPEQKMISPNKKLNFSDKYKQTLTQEKLNHQYNQYQKEQEPEQNQPIPSQELPQNQQQQQQQQQQQDTQKGIADLQDIIFNGLKILDQKVNQVLKESHDVRESQYQLSQEIQQSVMQIQNNQQPSTTQQSQISHDKKPSLYLGSVDNSEIFHKMDELRNRRQNSQHNIKSQQYSPLRKESIKESQLNDVNKYIQKLNTPYEENNNNHVSPQQNNHTPDLYNNSKPSQNSIGSQNFPSQNHQQHKYNSSPEDQNQQEQQHQGRSLQDAQQDQTSSRNILTSNSLYDMYMQEYNRLKQEKLSQQH